MLVSTSGVSGVHFQCCFCPVVVGAGFGSPLKWLTCGGWGGVAWCAVVLPTCLTVVCGRILAGLLIMHEPTFHVSEKSLAKSGLFWGSKFFSAKHWQTGLHHFVSACAVSTMLCIQSAVQHHNFMAPAQGSQTYIGHALADGVH